MQKKHKIPSDIRTVTQALRESQTFYRHLAELTPEAVVIHSFGKIVYINPTAQKFIGAKSAGDVIGEPVYKFIHPDSLPTIQVRIEKMLSKQKVAPTVEEKFISLNGEILIAEVKAVPFDFQGKPAIMAILHDITERKRLEERQEFINNINEHLSTSFDQEITLSDIGRTLVSYIADYYRIVLIDDRGNIKEIEVDHKDPRQVRLANDLYKSYINRPETTHGVRAILKSGNSELIRNIDDRILRTVKNNKKLVKIVKDIGLRSYMGAPLIARGKVIGAITLSSVRPNRYYSKADLKLLEDISHRIALSLDNVRLYHQAQQESMRLGEILFQAPAAIAMVEGSAHVYSMANPLYQQLVGKTVKQLIGKPGRKAIPEITAQGIWDLFDTIYKTGEPFIGNEYPVKFDRRGNGELDQGYFNFVGQPIKNNDGKVSGILIHAVEVTELVMARQKIQESETKLRRLIDSNIIGILFYTLNGDVTAANESFLQMMGYTKKDLAEKKLHWNEMSPKDYAKQDAKAIKEIQATGACTPYEKEFFRKDGSRVPVYIGAASFDKLSDSGVAFVLDITERKQLERQKDDFLSMASHELKTPITSMKMFVDLLYRQLKESNQEKPTYYVTRIRDQANRLSELTNDLLDVSRVQTGKLRLNFEVFKLEEIVTDIVEGLQATAPRHKIIVEDDTNILIYADRYRIYQVLVNLITNAIKYSPNGKKIIVTITKNKKTGIVGVKDFGIGIKKTQQKKIFDRLYQVNDPKEKTFPGLGLGLYISKEIVERHGGKIWVDSEKGKGAIFYFSLPLYSKTI